MSGVESCYCLAIELYLVSCDDAMYRGVWRYMVGEMVCVYVSVCVCVKGVMRVLIHISI